MAPKQHYEADGTTPKRSHKKRTAEQPSLPVEGMAGKRIPALDNAAKEYQEVKMERVALSQDEMAKKAKLHDLMNKENLKSYRVEDAVPPLIVTVEVVEETVSVKPEKKPKASDDE